ncbi:MAG: 4-(cytidine 5'-diphospho)-2-C-methyl-D-erythritol kinase [Mariniphaga sp.]|nr:4-(cytidine 5'-diphospho)-2-C-methyl-D-erythritol kinase [Mariniphaga sp.]MDD4226223.1 4-(cytidine 5'-diphospho)-2-C-methyl-D-erythritol kinase [Mariniphaga sp.]MDD4425834.1 4-(cytidine 5'-diphospho)-2-C-methyl-D-erythritol kinase [Mariniphaga sp.]
MIVFPNAKINIGLNIVARRNDGYHNLESFFYPVNLTDALEMAVTGKSGITCSGIPVDGPPDNNLVIKAYQLLKTEFQLPPVQFHLHKGIPSGAGLGGGSSDAAFTLKMLNQFFHLNLNAEKLENYAAYLGADCPFFIKNIPAFASGKGDILSPAHLDLSQFKLVIIKPDIAVNTAQAYKNVTPEIPGFSLIELSNHPVPHWKNFVKNDFEKSVFSQFPEIEMWKNKLYELGAVFASMSGSGSAVYGFFQAFPPDLNNKIPKSILFTL